VNRATKTSIALSSSTIDRRQQPNKRQKVREIEPSSPVESSEASGLAQGWDERLDEIQSTMDNEIPEQHTNVRKTLNRKVKELMKNVKDPLDDCVATAQSTRAVHKVAQTEDDSSSEEGIKLPPLQQKKKKKAYQLKFNSPGESNNSEEEGEGVACCALARYEHFKPSAIHVSQIASPTKRNWFTDAEDEVIRKGVEEFGAGKWKLIKSKYAVELRNRNSGAIKDRWRNHLRIQRAPSERPWQG
jgi:Myb-like DNA-binding domain